MSAHEIRVTINGEAHCDVVESRVHLADYLRRQKGLTGVHLGCEHGVCGACTVLVDGASMRSCLTFAVQADGKHVRTVEGLAPRDGGLHALQALFARHHALQCGFCTPGMVMATVDLLRRCPVPTDQDIAEGLAGNLCRCTGYVNIAAAVKQAAQQLQGGAA